MKINNLMAIDLEMNQPSNSIIQIGVAVGSLETGAILHSSAINVYQPEEISDFIIGLTGITQAEVDEGVPLTGAYAELVSIHKQFNCFMNPVQWGHGDAELLRKQLGLEDDKWIFGRRCIDAKTVFISRCLARGQPIQSGLAKSMTRVGLRFEGKKHNAGSDAENTLRIYFKLLEEMKK